MIDVCNVVPVFLNIERAVRSGAIHEVVFSLGPSHSNSACLCKCPKAPGVNDATLVALASYKFANRLPDAESKLDMITSDGHIVSSVTLVSVSRFKWIFNGHESGLAC